MRRKVGDGRKNGGHQWGAVVNSAGKYRNGYASTVGPPIRCLADMDESEIEAIELAYGAPVTRPIQRFVEQAER